MWAPMRIVQLWIQIDLGFPRLRYTASRLRPQAGKGTTMPRALGMPASCDARVAVPLHGCNKLDAHKKRARRPRRH
jgi:hypothetical protein